MWRDQERPCELRKREKAKRNGCEKEKGDKGDLQGLSIDLGVGVHVSGPLDCLAAERGSVLSISAVVVDCSAGDCADCTADDAPIGSAKSKSNPSPDDRPPRTKRGPDASTKHHANGWSEPLADSCVDSCADDSAVRDSTCNLFDLSIQKLARVCIP